MYAILITDDADDAAIFSLALQRAGLAVATARNLETALKGWSERPADLILSATEEPAPEKQVRQVRAVTLVPLIMAVENRTDHLHYDLLKLGADLVIAGPFNVKLLIAQIGVLMRRAGSVPAFALPTLDAPGITVDPSNRTVKVADKSAQHLTHLEFRLLYTLMTNRNQAVTTDSIVDAVWGYTGQGDRDLVRGLVNRLRAKIEENRSDPRYIITVPGVGYMFNHDRF